MMLNKEFTKSVLILCALFKIITIQSQTLKNTSYQNSQGERVLRFEMIVPIDIESAWRLFTDDNQLKKWIAPLAHIELKLGGFIVTNYNSNLSLNDKSSIILPIQSYLDKEILILKVNLNDHFPASAQESDENLQEVIQFIKIGKHKTKIISSMIGWGAGDDWDKTYNFFVKGNQYTCEMLIKNYQ